MPLRGRDADAVLGLGAKELEVNVAGATAEELELLAGEEREDLLRHEQRETLQHRVALRLRLVQPRAQRASQKSCRLA